MARDGLFFHGVARIHPSSSHSERLHSVIERLGRLLVLSGRYDQLYTYVIFASVILYGMATASVIVLRIRRPDMARPYRTTRLSRCSHCFRAGNRLLDCFDAGQFAARIPDGTGPDCAGPAVLFLLEKAPSA